MRRLALIPLLALAVLPLVAGLAGAQESPRGVLVIGLPTDQVRALAVRRPIASGLGVYAPSRDARAFLAVLANGDASGGGVARAAGDAGVAIGVGVAAGAAGSPPGAVGEAFGDAGSVGDALDEPISVVGLHLADDAEALLRLQKRPAIVIGSDGRTPLLVGLIDGPSDGLLRGSAARRTGVVTPADLAATILDVAGVGGVGRPLIVVPAFRPLERLDALAARWEADLAFPQPLTIGTVAVGLGAVVLGSLALIAGLARLTRAIAVGAALAPAGYVAALFLEGASWQARVGVMVAAFLAGTAASVAGARRAAGWLTMGTTFGLAAVTTVAASAPDGAVAAGLWGDPLVSWRFFGLRNHLAMFLTGGYVAGATLLALPTWLFVSGGVVIGFVVGAATLGANFVAVAVLGFAVALVVLARAAGRPRFLHLPFAGVAGVLATIAALLADAGSPVSHGGRAVEGVRSGGFEAAWDIIARRARLNYEEITGIGILGVVGFVLAACALALLFWWALREDDAEPVARAGAGGLAAAALVTLVVEDSGFFVGSILGLYPWIVFILDRAARRDPLTLPAVAPPRADAAR